MAAIPQIDSFDKHSFSANTSNGDTIAHGVYSRGVGPVKPGDVLRGEIDGLMPVDLTIGEPEA